MAFRIKQMPDREYFADPGLDQSALKRFMVSGRAQSCGCQRNKKGGA